MSVTPEQYKYATERLARHAARDLNRIYARLDLNHPLGAVNALTEEIPKLVRRYGDAVASIAREWYDEMRLIDGVPGGYRSALGQGISKEFIERRLKYAAGHLFTDDPLAMLPLVEGFVNRYILDYGRETIRRNVRRDPRAVGWMRVTSVDACDFCQMLSGRGGVYKDTTVTFASHDDCNCSAMPSWDPNAEEVPVELYEMSQRRYEMSDAERGLQNERIRAYIEQMG